MILNSLIPIHALINTDIFFHKTFCFNFCCLIVFLSYFAFQFHIILHRMTNIYSLLIRVAFAKQTTVRTISSLIHNQQFFKPFSFSRS
jgi:hypothetical protein